MKQIKRLEDSLNGGFGGLYGEVVTCDTYGITRLDFVPELVFDIGANVGIFTRFARSLFPRARIVSIEPHPENREVFQQFTPPDERITLLPWALGRGPTFRSLTAVNGSGESYISACLGFPGEILAASAGDGTLEKTNVEGRPLWEIVNPFWTGQPVLIKIDCEGAENTLWDDVESMGILRRADYVCMEIHSYAFTGAELAEVKRRQEEALASLSATHICERNHVHFLARKKK